MTDTLKVAQIYGSIQGEGFYTGVPMTIVRLQGCQVRCPWCDTRESWDPSRGRTMTVQDILDTVSSRVKWVMLTGGEPLEQDVTSLVIGLQTSGHSVLIETSGTQDLPTPGCYPDWLCVSPKLWALSRTSHRILRDAHEIKFVVQTAEEIRIAAKLLRELNLVGSVDGYPKPVVSVQPVDCDPEGTKTCMDAAYALGWRVSIQVHKLIGVA